MSILCAEHITKRFPGVRALDDVSFSLEPGEIHALMGENGAGKSTLIKVLTGVYRPEGGTITLEGCPIMPASPAQAQELGISTVYQEVNLIPTLTVAENLLLGRQPRRLGMLDWAETYSRAESALARLSLGHIDVRAPLGRYSLALQQMVAIARAVDIDAKCLILDEPTSSLDSEEVTQLFSMMRQLREQGLGLVFVTHFLDQVYEVCDRITVLRNGGYVGTWTTAELPKVQLVSRMMGRELASFEEERHVGRDVSKASGAPVRLKIEARSSELAGEISVQIRQGEVVGVAGLLGSGRTEVARIAFGLAPDVSGTVACDQHGGPFADPAAAIAAGVAMVPEDRKEQSIIPDLSVRENVILALQARRGVFKRLPMAEQIALADCYIGLLGIKTPHREQAIKNLSGGNQQKAIIARWLATEPQLLILDEPTRGVDVGAKAEILKLTLSLCEDGLSILFISAELEEVIRCCDRVVVMRDRRMVRELTIEGIGEQDIMAAIAGQQEVEA